MIECNKITGALGAPAGAALGTGIWCLTGLFGKIAFVGGSALCLGAFGGYYLPGKGISIAIYRISDGTMSFGSCFADVLKLSDAMDDKTSFCKDLGPVYPMTVGGAFFFLYKLGVFEE